MVEFIGLGVTNDFTDYHPRTTRMVDLDYLKKVVEIHENTGWDGLLFYYSSPGVDPGVIGAYAASLSKRLKIIIAVRPNTCTPTFFAKQIASLNSIAGEARFGMHLIAGGYAGGQRAEGDFSGKDVRYEKMAEYLNICRLVWTETDPFSYNGEHFQIDNFRTNFDFPKPPNNLISTAGTSEAALRMAAKHSRRHAVWGLPLADTKEIMDKIRFYARQEGRQDAPDLQMHFRPVLGATSSAAHNRAEQILSVIAGNFEGLASGRPPLTGGEVRAQSVIARGAWHDECFWAGPVAETGGAGNSTALVGTPDQLAGAFQSYLELGVTSFGINGFDSLEDSQAFGDKVIPLVRKSA